MNKKTDAFRTIKPAQVFVGESLSSSYPTSILMPTREHPQVNPSISVKPDFNVLHPAPTPPLSTVLKSSYAMKVHSASTRVPPLPLLE